MKVGRNRKRRKKGTRSEEAENDGRENNIE
jgi:hypothetical protein